MASVQLLPPAALPAAWVVAVALGSPALQAQPRLEVPLECQLRGSAWQPCTLTIERLGEHWWLQVQGERLEFRSDGRGRITLIDAAGARQAVQPIWTAQQALCWDGVCAKGDLPLD